MSQPQTELRTVERLAPDSPPDPSAPTLSLGSQQLRFDGPELHRPHSDDVSAVTTVPLPGGPSPLSEKAKLLADAAHSMLLAHQQMESLIERERHLATRLAELEQAERRFRLWAQESQAELDERTRLLDAREAELTHRLAQLELRQSDCEAASQTLQAERDALQHERDDLQRQIQEQADRERQSLAAEREALAAQQLKVQELGDALLEQHRLQQSRLEEQLRQEREQLWISLTAEWEQERTRFQQEQAEFHKDRALLENRLRFQQEHLDKTRAELERDQRIVLREQQAARDRLEAAETQLRLRKAHLDRYRATLEEFDRALERERDVTGRMREAMSSNARQEQQRYLAERQAWDDERSQQQAELRRQQELLLAHSEHLETRRVRLEALRREVEETSHATMELRFAVEDVWAQLQTSLGLSVAQEKVEEARLAIAHDYEQWQARLAEQRQELIDAERQLEQQRLTFQEERRTLLDWIAERDQDLQRREREHRESLAQQASDDAARQEFQERWLRERDEAEQVIRSLIRDLLERAAELPQPDATAIAASES